MKDELLTEITIDHYSFYVTSNPAVYGSCILWCRDINTPDSHQSVGKFKRFNKKSIVHFMMDYAAKPDLRFKINNLKFEQKLETLPLEFFRTLKYKSQSRREEMFKAIFDLDDSMEKGELTRRRRIMAKKFHPDAGGNDDAMSIINEAYDFLLSHI